MGLILFNLRVARAQPGEIPKTAHYERHDGKDRVVVFVHGLYGDARESWLCKSDRYWPRLLLSDHAFDQADVYVASYDTPRSGNSLTVDEVVSGLFNRLENDGVFTSHKEVIFVAHSLGGLIVQRMLLIHRDVQPKVSFIYFYATPQTGSKAANIASLFKGDPLLGELKTGEGNFFLPSVETDWLHANFRSTRRYCAFETKKEHSFKVVDRLSATRNCEDAVAIPDVDHNHIVKPCSTEDLAYIILRNKFHDTQLVETQPVPIPAPTTMFQQNNYAPGNLQIGNLYQQSPGRRLTREQIETIGTSLASGPKGHLLIIAMLPFDKEMRDFGNGLRTAAAKGGWTHEGTTLDTQSHRTTIYLGSEVLETLPQGTHCVATPSADLKDTRAQDFTRMLVAAGVNCSSGEKGLYPADPKATLTIYIGVNIE